MYQAVVDYVSGTAGAELEMGCTGYLPGRGLVGIVFALASSVDQ